MSIFDLCCSYGILMKAEEKSLCGLVHMKTTVNSFAMQVIHQLS